MSPRWTRLRSRACLVVDGTSSCGAVPDLPGRLPHHDGDLDGDDTILHQLELSRSGVGHVEDATRVQGVEETRSLIRSSTSRPVFRLRTRTRESNGIVVARGARVAVKRLAAGPRGAGAPSQPTPRAAPPPRATHHRGRAGPRSGTPDGVRRGHQRGRPGDMACNRAASRSVRLKPSGAPDRRDRPGDESGLESTCFSGHHSTESQGFVKKTPASRPRSRPCAPSNRVRVGASGPRSTTTAQPRARRCPRDHGTPRSNSSKAALAVARAAVKNSTLSSIIGRF